MIRFAVVAGWLAMAVLAQAPHKALPADWPDRDLEGKWVAFQVALAKAPADKELPQALVKALGAAGEMELLEWIAIYHDWRLAGPELVAHDAPQWLRAAMWGLGNYDSHGQDAVEKQLRHDSARTLGWLERWPEGRVGRAGALRDKLVAEGVRAAANANDLPPLDAMQILVPALDAPAELVEFGDRLRSEPKGHYVHQVVRALAGVLTGGFAEPLVLAKVLALTRHGHATVRRAAFDTLAKLPPELVPFAAMQQLLADATAVPERRRLAVLVLSHSSHPAVQDELIAMATAPTHPGHDNALQRLGEVGDPLATAALHAQVGVLPMLVAPLRRIEQRRVEHHFAAPAAVQALLLRAAWRRQRGVAAADEVTALAELLRSSLPDRNLATVLAAWRNAPPLPSPFAGDEAKAIAAGVAALAAALEALANADGK